MTSGTGEVRQTPTIQVLLTRERAFASYKLPAKYIFRVSFFAEGVSSALRNSSSAQWCPPSERISKSGYCLLSLCLEPPKLQTRGTMHSCVSGNRPSPGAGCAPHRRGTTLLIYSLVPPQCPPYITGSQGGLGRHIKRVLGCVSPVPSGKQFWGLSVSPFWPVAPLCRART